MRKALLPLAFAGVFTACSSDAGGVDPDAIPVAQKHALWMALDSAFRHDTTLDPGFTGDSGLYALMSTLVISYGNGKVTSSIEPYRNNTVDNKRVSIPTKTTEPARPRIVKHPDFGK